MKDEDYQKSHLPAGKITASTDRKSGRVAFDADGRGIWEWQITTGVFTRTVTEDQLMSLAATNLQIAETPAARDEQRLWTHVPEPARRGAGASVSPARASAASPMRRFLRRLTGAT